MYLLTFCGKKNRCSWRRYRNNNHPADGIRRRFYIIVSSPCLKIHTVWRWLIFTCFVCRRYGRVQSVKILARSKEEVALGGSGVCATVSFMDIKSASKAHNMEQKLDDRCLSTEYHEPAAIPSASPTIPSHLYPAPTRPYIHGWVIVFLFFFSTAPRFFKTTHFFYNT